jgi:hypothetical protein
MEFRPESQREERKRLGLLTLTEAAKTLSIKRDMLVWYLRSGQIAPPAATIVGRPRAYYQNTDLEGLRQFFQAKL